MTPVMLCARVLAAIRARFRVFGLVIAAGGLAAPPAAAIVSDRHLRGVNALQCDLEPGANAPAFAFRLLVHAKDRMLQLAGAPERFGYQEVSDSTLRFRLALAHGVPLDCDLELPAGALACTAAATPTPRLGLCLPSS
jgi:hypothetical protein